MALRMRAGAGAVAVCIESSKGSNPRFLSVYHPHLRLKFPSSVALSLDRKISPHPKRQVGSVYERGDKSFATFKHRIRAINSEAAVESKVSSVKEDEKQSENWKIKMLYDGECPLCMREVNMLDERNKLYGTIKFVDISSAEYSAEENQGIDYKTAMGRIHAIESDGTIVTDVEAFRRLYEEVGLGWVYAVTKYKPVAVLANAVYAFWAKYRMQITGRPSLEDVLEARMKNKGEVCNDNKACKM